MYLNSSSYDDAHEEIGYDTCNGHHQALNHCDTGVEVQDEEDVVWETRMKAHHEIAYWSWRETYQDQERQRWDGVGNNKCRNTVVPIQPLSLENLWTS